MKKILTTLCVIALALVCLFVLPTRAEAAIEGDYEYSISGGKATIARYNGFGGDVTIPVTLGGYPVATIGHYAFYDCDSLTSVTIPNSVTTIEKYAFRICDNLTKVVIGDGVTAIGDEAFYYCRSLTGVTIGNSVTTIGNDAFGYCESLTTITIPDSVTTIGKNAFSFCYYLTSVTIPDSVTNIGVGVFQSCNNLLSITIPDGVTAIEDYTFYGCNSLNSVTIGNGVTRIGSAAFYDCNRLWYVYYAGSADLWNKIDIGSGNGCLTKYGISYDHVHDFSLTPPVTEQPTCTQMGYTEYTCVHGEKHREYISALGHSYIEKETEPTCTEQGYTTHTCHCGDTYVDTYVKALGHDHDAVVTEPSCTEQGYTTHTCHCGDTYVTDYVDALGHSYTKGKCARCGYTPVGVKITTQPKSVKVAPGQTAKVTVKATGDGLKYTWYHKSANATKYSKSSVTGATYAVKMSSSVHGRYVYCVITDQYGNSVKTSVVRVYQGNPVKVTTQPKSVKVAPGKTAKVTVKATGDGLKYTWYHKSANATKYSKSSVTSATYSVKMSSSVHGRYVYCVITDQYGNSVKTSVVRVYQGKTVKITTQPVNVAVKNGKTAKVTVKATGDGLKYTWYHKSAKATKYSKSSVTGATYSVKMSSSVSGRKVYCVITDQYGNSVKTNTVTLYKGNPAKITTQPKSTTVKAGKTAKMTVKASGDGLTYTWYYAQKGATKWSKSGITKNVFSVKMAAKWNGCRVYCVVKDKYGTTVKSSVVTLKMK